MISTAFAEAAETAATTASTAASSMSVTTMLFLALGIYNMVQGLMCISQKKLINYGKDTDKKYTAESQKAYAPFYGLALMLIGAGLAVDGLPVESLKQVVFTIGNSWNIQLSWVIFLGLVIIGLIVMFVGSKKLVRKDKQDKQA